MREFKDYSLNEKVYVNWDTKLHWYEAIVDVFSNSYMLN